VVVEVEEEEEEEEEVKEEVRRIAVNSIKGSWQMH